MHILVLHNKIEGNATAADSDVLVQAEAFSGALRLAGHTVDSMPVTLNLDALQQSVLSAGVDLAVNLVESLGGHDRLAPLAPTLLDVLGCPYTGAPASALSLLSDKVLAKDRLSGSGLPTPDWCIGGHCYPEAEDGNPRSFPTAYIVKPRYDHASCGIDSSAIVSASSPNDIDIAIADRQQRLGRACFAERFVDGREFNLSILAGPHGPEVLPPAEIVFADFSPDRPRIVDYDAKWEPESFGYRHTPRRFSFPESDTGLLNELAELTSACWRLFGLQGYARVDFRVDPDNRPWILEVNANPCLSPDAGFAAAVEQAGYTFHKAVDRIVADAFGQDRHPATTAGACHVQPNSQVLRRNGLVRLA